MDAALAAPQASVRSAFSEVVEDRVDGLVDAEAGGIEPEADATAVTPIGFGRARWPHDFPKDIAVLRRAPYESQADSVMYRRAIAAVAQDLGWEVHLFDARTAEVDVAALIGDRANEVLHGPRRRLGPPWTKDHRMALAATVLAERAGG